MAFEFAIEIRIQLHMWLLFHFLCYIFFCRFINKTMTTKMILYKILICVHAYSIHSDSMADMWPASKGKDTFLVSQMHMWQ